MQRGPSAAFTSKRAFGLTLLLILCGLAPLAWGQDLDEIADLVDRRDYEAIKALGPDIMPELAALYDQRRADPTRQHVAWAYYQLGWKSEQAVEVLMPDVVGDRVPIGIRISAQYALGRVSDDEIVVQTLLHNMRRGRTPRIRDKAACALAYDQIHLNERQKLALFRALVASLDDPKPDVRRISLQALKIHTGQTRGYAIHAPRSKRLAAMERWHRWIQKYAEQL